MKLTNLMRDSFIRAAMDDVPKIDYSEQISKLILEDAVSQLPPKIRAIYNDKQFGHYIHRDRVYVGGAGRHLPKGADNFKAKPETLTKVTELEAKTNAQSTHMSELRSKIRGCAYACNTRKALLDLLPEFEKYLPADEAAACRTLPVVANVVSDFVKAGWPAGKPVPAKSVRKPASQA